MGVGPRCRRINFSPPAVELRNRLETSLGHSLSATIIFDYPTFDGLVNHLLDVVFDEPATEIQSDEEIAKPAGVPELDDLSEAEIAALLADELEQIKQRKSK